MSVFWQAIILGIVQGLTEFLPISSTAHLLLCTRWMEWDYFGKSFDLALHGGSLLALLFFFRNDLASGVQGCWTFVRSYGRKWPERLEERLGAIVLITMIPTAACGLLLNPLVERYLQSSGILITCLALFGLLLGWVDKMQFHREQRLEADLGNGGEVLSDQRTPAGLLRAGWCYSLLMGLAQGVAFIPGVSRSGACLTMARALGLSRKQAIHLSMFMAIPVIGAAISVKLVHGFPLATNLDQASLIAGVCTSALFSWLSLGLITKLSELLRWVAWYRIILALILLWTLAQ